MVTTLGQELKRLRENMHLTQAEAADRAGIKRATLSVLETQPKKRPSKDIIKKLADLYGVTENYLLDLTWHAKQGQPAPRGQIESYASAFKDLRPEVQTFVIEMIPSLEKLLSATRLETAQRVREQS